MPHPRGARSNRPPSSHRWLTPLAALVAAACTPARTAPTLAPAASCLVGEARQSAGSADTLSLATMAQVEPAHAPDPTNAAERLVFAQLYRTLVDVDCEGRARPGLARSWTPDPAGSRVTLTLADAARFWDGTPILAADVLAAWRATAARSTESSSVARRVAEATTIVDDHTLTVSLPDTAWLVLADRALAVYRPRSGDGWAEGSGRYRIAGQSGRGGSLLLAPVAAPSDALLLVLHVASGDPRDAIDAGADLLVTDDPVAVSYAEARADLESVPLPWTRTYALAVPPRPSSDAESLPLGIDSPAFRASLARDAVHGEARPTEPPYWWNGASGCGTPTLDFGVPFRGSNRVVYRRDDAIARGLAERLVALGRGAAAAGLAPEDFAHALRAGGDLAYVIALPRGPVAPCEELAALRAAAPWLAMGDAARSSLAPLVDTRERAIVKRGRVSATIDREGAVVLGTGTAP